jgi:hypothetical protein
VKVTTHVVADGAGLFGEHKHRDGLKAKDGNNT